MDPNAAWRMLNDPLLDREDRLHAGGALISWIATGGFIPDAACFTGKTPRQAIDVVQRQIDYVRTH